MVKVTYYSLVAGSALAAPWNFPVDHELSRGTATMPHLYDPYNDPNYAPEPKRAPTIFSNSNQTGEKCKMNPWIFLALVDSNYSNDEKYKFFASRKDNGQMIKNENNGVTNDAMFLSLINCSQDKNIQKLMAIDAMANQRPDIISDIFSTTTDAKGTDFQYISKEDLFGNPLEFYNNYWKYNKFIEIFHNTGYSKWFKINELFKIVGNEIDPITKYKDRKMLMSNLNQPMLAQATRPSRYLPRFSSYTPQYKTWGPWGSSSSSYSSRPAYNQNNFMAYQPANSYAPPANQQQVEKVYTQAISAPIYRENVMTEAEIVENEVNSFDNQPIFTSNDNNEVAPVQEIYPSDEAVFVADK